MSYPFPVSLLDIDRQPGKAPIVRAEAPGDGLSWVAEHRDALRAAVAEHGSVMVRGLDLHNAPEVSAVFRRLATGLMTERERGLCVPADLLRRRVLLIDVATEPADVHAP
jgi:hypothetical protein